MNEEVEELMEEYDIDEDVAEQALEYINEGFDEAEAVELAENT